MLQKYNAKEQIIHMYNEGGRTSTFNRLAVIVYLINDYYENGLYTNTQEIIETNGMGEIHWDKTINGTFPIIKENRPYYVELQTKKRATDDNDFFKRLHECLLTLCSKELADADLPELLDITGIELTDETLIDLGEDDYLLYAADFSLPYGNLHGQNSYKYGEISNRRMLVQTAVKALVTKGLVEVKIDKGYFFAINNLGKTYVKKLKSDYAKEYRTIAKATIKKYRKDSDKGILAEIQSYSIRSLKG